MTVTRVVDGDTIEIRPAINGIEDVRLIGVDTPETVDPSTGVQPYGPQASRFTTREFEGEQVQLEFDQEREDQFGRLLAYVHLADGTLFNETLLRQGYAQLFIVPPNDKYEARFRAAQEEARDAERGLWGLPQAQLCQLTDRGNGIGEGSPGCTDTPSPTTDRDCPDFSSQAAAQAQLERDPTDPHRLDADEDGQACEDFDYAGGSVDDDPDDHQYNTDGKEVTVIVETIPDKKVLVDTGGSALVTIGVFVALGFMGLGINLLRRA